MDINKNRKRDSIRKSRKSSSNSTYCKPVKNSTQYYDSSDAEIEFEGWIEFVTKKDKNNNNGSLEKKKKLDRNNTRNGLYLKKSEKTNASFKKTNSKNSANTNVTNSESSYASTNIIYKKPESLSNNNLVHQVNNGKNAFFINQQEIGENSNNILNPIHVDSATPVIFKNQQNLPHLYIRQPPTVVVSNEQRPPLFINPPPANVIFENQSPQPIYVNSARPNIIIKNDPPILQNSTNMDIIPIQMNNPIENDPFRMNFINVPSSIELKGATLADNTCHIKESVNTFGTALPTKFIQLDNNLGELPHKMIANAYVVKDNQYRNLFQTHNAFSTINPNNNTIHVQHNPGFNEYDANVIQNIGTPFTQIFAQPNHNTTLLNKQVIENPIMQVAPPTSVQTFTPEPGQLTPQFCNFQSYANIPSSVAYEHFYSPPIMQNTIENIAPQVIHQNPIQSAAIPATAVPDNFQIAASVQNQVLHQPNITPQKPKILQYQKGIPHQFNHHKQTMHPSCASNNVLPTYSLSCIPNTKPAQAFPLRRNMHINPNEAYKTPQKVQVITTPFHNKGFKGYHVAQ